MTAQIIDGPVLIPVPVLDPYKAEIRLLELQPGALESPIHCEYCIESLDNPCLLYEALSYAWADGISQEDHMIYIHERGVKVSSNLFSALQRLRPVNAKRYLWVDALCINQADEHEKTQQVNMMRRIYMQCSQCAIWLGGFGKVQPYDVQMAFDTISWLAGAKPSPDWTQHLLHKDRVAAALKSVMNVRWWSRIWTVQECILPEQATIYWGSCELSRAAMHKAADNFFNNLAPSGIPSEFWGNGAIIDLQVVFRGFEFSRSEETLYLLWRWRYRQASEARDKVYGIMGIREDLSLSSVSSCDYTIDVQTLYRRVTIDLIRASGDLMPLIGRRGEIQVTEQLPSWTIDWVSSSAPSQHISDFWTHSRRWHGLSCCADKGVLGIGEGLKVVDERILCLHGVFVDTIAVIEQPSNSRNPNNSFYELFMSGGDRWSKIIQQYQELHPGMLPENWLRAILGVLSGKLVPEDADYGDHLEDWTQSMARNQSFFVTSHGFFGLGPQSIKPGQQVWVVGGSRFPFVLDPLFTPPQTAPEKHADFSFVGDCFVYGIMKGEAVENGRHKEIEFRLH